MRSEVTIMTADGFEISATSFSPSSEIKGGVVINSATAVKQSYYEKFAEFLVQNGYLVVTYDYRGIGRSAIKNSRDNRLTMQAWGEKDLAAVIDWTRKEFGDLDWHCIGHSVGGQIIGLADNNTHFKSVYCVSAQSGYWNHWESFNKPKVFVMWYALIPGLSILLGKVPGIFLGGESLPEGIARQWAFWGRNKNYIVDRTGKPIREGFHRLESDMKFLIIDDDKFYAPPNAVKALKNYYRYANSVIEVIKTKEYGNRTIGHFGFFRKQNKDGLWLGVINWLKSFD